MCFRPFKGDYCVFLWVFFILSVCFVLFPRCIRVTDHIPGFVWFLMFLCTAMFPRFGYVCASKTMALRRLLEAANSDMGFTNQEKGMCVKACTPLESFCINFPLTCCRCNIHRLLVWSDWGMLSCCCCSFCQILKSSSTSFSSSSESSRSSRSGDLTATVFVYLFV